MPVVCLTIIPAMKLRNRFSLVGLGVVIFLIITPVLVLFARGFQLDLKNRQFIKTGILVVATQPDKAQVVIDDKPFKRLTPSTVRFLLPGDYVVRVEKDGYFSWTKRLSIKSQFVTWANLNLEFITLFLKKPIEQSNQVKLEDLKKESKEPTQSTWQIKKDQLMRNGEIVIEQLPAHTQHQIIENGDYLLLLLDTTLYKLNGKLDKIYQPITSAYWDEPSSRLILANSNEILLFDPLAASPDLILRSISEIQNAQLNWHTGYVFFQNGGKIKAIELDGRDHRNVYTLVDAGKDFILDKEGRKLYVIGETEIREYVIR